MVCYNCYKTRHLSKNCTYKKGFFGHKLNKNSNSLVSALSTEIENLGALTRKFQLTLDYSCVDLLICYILIGETNVTIDEKRLTITKEAEKCYSATETKKSNLTIVRRMKSSIRNRVSKEAVAFDFIAPVIPLKAI